MKKVPGEQDPDFRETAMVWYQGAKVVTIDTTCLADAGLLQRRGWEPVGGEEGRQALPYLRFRIPRKAISFRSADSMRPKRRKK